MRKSKDERVEKFLEEISLLNQVQYRILQELRELVFTTFPQVEERMMYGGIMFSLEKDFGGIFASKQHVSFEFGHGYMMQDPQGLLDGTGKFRRHLKIKSLSDIKDKNVAFFLKQVG
jgi:hypothetical protein